MAVKKKNPETVDPIVESGKKMARPSRAAKPKSAPAAKAAPVAKKAVKPVAPKVSATNILEPAEQPVAPANPLGLYQSEELILLAVVKVGDDAYGTPIRATLLDAKYEIHPTALGTLLNRMEKKGFVKSKMKKGVSLQSPNVTVKTFALTASGKKILDQTAKRRAALAS